MMRLLSKIKNNKALTPVNILTLLGVWTILYLSYHKIREPDITYFPSDRPKFYFGLLAIALNYVSYFYFRAYYKYLLVATLVLGLFDVINFSKIDFVRTYSINSLEFKPSPIIALVISLLVYSKQLFTPDPNMTELASAVNELSTHEDIEKFKQLYQNKPTEELQVIREDKRFTDSAKEAARQLMEERQNKVE